MTLFELERGNLVDYRQLVSNCIFSNNVRVSTGGWLIAGDRQRQGKVPSSRFWLIGCCGLFRSYVILQTCKSKLLEKYHEVMILFFKAHDARKIMLRTDLMKTGLFILIIFAGMFLMLLDTRQSQQLVNLFIYKCDRFMHESQLYA